MNIVIADDEQIILKWMKKNIEALSPDNHVIGVCSNGNQALECCLNQKVDVLFTDIRMPVMDGMELLEKLNENQVLPYTVILSAYDDFSYARDCFKLGIKEFLLKSEITREEIEKCLQTAWEELKNSGENRVDKGSAKEQLQNLLLQKFRDTETVSKSNLEQYWNELCDIKGKYIVMTLHSSSKALNTEQCEEIAAFLFQEMQLKFYYIPQKEKKTVILAELPGDSLSAFTEKFYNAFASFGYKDISVNVSPYGSSCEELDTLHEFAEDVYLYQDFYHKVGGLDYETMKKQKSRIYQELEQKFKELEELLNTYNSNEIIEKLKQIFAFIRQTAPTLPVIRRLILNSLLNVYWKYLDEVQREQFSVDEIIVLSNSSDLEQLEKRSLSQMEAFMTLLNKKYSIYSESICKIIEYIEMNYAAPISLDELADYVHMNRSYISHLFKKETGENINAYLLNFRLERAKELLLRSKNSIQQICYEIGIPDSAYFSKVFKKTVGVSPLEFRKINQ